MIKLFDVKDKEFKTNGIMNIMPLSLIEYKDTSLNGWYIEAEVPIKYNDDIKEGMIAFVETKSKGGQPFRIFNLKRTDKLLHIKANHITFDTIDYVLDDVRPTNMSAAGALKYVNDRTDTKSPFTTNSNVEGSNTAYFINKNFLEALDTIQERWGGVYDPDKFLIELRTKVGVDRGETIMYGKNLEGLSVFEDWSAVVTKLRPVGYDGITLPEQYIYSEIDYGKPYTKVVKFETELEDDDRTEAALIKELRDNAIAYLRENEVPKISYEIESNINQNMGIGDTIHVKHPVVDILTNVIAYEYNVLTKRTQKIVFGNYVRSVKKKVNVIKDIINDIENKTNNFDVIIKDQTDLINSLNKYGYVYQDDNQIMIVDKLPKEEAQKVWRWNAAGLGYSKNGIEGPYEYAWTMDGTFNTNFISANSIMTNQLHSDVGSGLDISSNESITSIVSSINRIKVGDNIMYNLNGEYDISGWYFGLENEGLKWLYRTRWFQGMAWGSNFVPVLVTSLSQYAIKFVSKGLAKTSKTYVVPLEEYSYRGRRMSGNTDFTIKFVEYNAEKVKIKETPFIFSGTEDYSESTIKTSQNTMYIELWFEYPNSEETVITEQMFNRGEPVSYREGALDAKMFAETKITQIDESIKAEAKRIDSVTGDIHNAGIEINAEEGINVHGKKFVITNEDKTKEIFRVKTVDGEEQVYMYGSIQSEGGEIAFDSENKQVKIGNAILKGSYVGATPSLLINSRRFEIKSEEIGESVWIRINGRNVIIDSGTYLAATFDNIQPATTGLNIGSGDNRYDYLFLKNQPNVSSDKRYKYNVSHIDDMLLDEFEHLERKSFVTKHDDKYSFGYIAQDVERCLYKFILKVWGYSEANKWLGKFKLLSRGESYLSLLYAEVDIIMAEVQERKIKRLQEENRLKQEQHEQLRREFDTLVEILKEKGVI